MKYAFPLAQRAAILCAVLLLAACANFGGRGLQPGVATESDVLATMGVPGMRWDDPDGSRQLAYPRGPAGHHTFMVFIGPDGRLLRIENALDPDKLGRVEPGRSDLAAVLRLLGPPVPEWTVYFETRDELVWEWRFCDAWNESARFDVLFDARTGIVRSTFQWPESSVQRRRTLCGR